MDVSRIEAISPKQIDWRKLTAKEIIKYESTGIEVPPEYLQWARAFHADLEANDTDEVTYEKDTSQQLQTQNPQEIVSIDTSEQDGEVSDDMPPEDKTAAQSKREELQNAGVSLRSQARIFTKDSKEATRETFLSAAVISVMEDLSNNEIQALDSHMKEILSKAEADQNELKGEITKINDSKNRRKTQKPAILK